MESGLHATLVKLTIVFQLRSGAIFFPDNSMIAVCFFTWPTNKPVHMRRRKLLWRREMKNWLSPSEFAMEAHTPSFEGILLVVSTAWMPEIPIFSAFIKKQSHFIPISAWGTGRRGDAPVFGKSTWMPVQVIYLMSFSFSILMSSRSSFGKFVYVWVKAFQRRCYFWRARWTCRLFHCEKVGQSAIQYSSFQPSAPPLHWRIFKDHPVSCYLSLLGAFTWQYSQNVASSSGTTCASLPLRLRSEESRTW